MFLSGLRVGVQSCCAKTSRYIRRHWAARQAADRGTGGQLPHRGDLRCTHLESSWTEKWSGRAARRRARRGFRAAALSRRAREHKGRSCRVSCSRLGVGWSDVRVLRTIRRGKELAGARGGSARLEVLLGRVRGHGRGARVGVAARDSLRSARAGRALPGLPRRASTTDDDAVAAPGDLGALTILRRWRRGTCSALASSCARGAFRSRSCAVRTRHRR